MRKFRFVMLASVICTVVLFAGGCSVTSSKSENGDGKKNVAISTPFGGMKVNTDKVEAKDTGISTYPGATAVEKHDGEEKKANVNLDTPWFGLKVVALTFKTADPTDKVWEFYKKDLSQYGRVLECKPGSPDLSIEKQDKDDLTCRDDDKSGRRSYHRDEMSLRTGKQGKQRIVAIKPDGTGTEFSLVYVGIREKRETQ